MIRILRKERSGIKPGTVHGLRPDPRSPHRNRRHPTPRPCSAHRPGPPIRAPTHRRPRRALRPAQHHPDPLPRHRPRPALPGQTPPVTLQDLHPYVRSPGVRASPRWPCDLAFFQTRRIPRRAESNGPGGWRCDVSRRWPAAAGFPGRRRNARAHRALSNLILLVARALLHWGSPAGLRQDRHLHFHEIRQNFGVLASSFLGPVLLLPPPYQPIALYQYLRRNGTEVG